MAEGKKSFILYADLLLSVEHLTDEELGKLFRHLLEYVNDQDPELNDRLLLTAWKPIERILKQDLDKWRSIQKKRAEAGAKGGKQKVANAKIAKQKLANVAVSDSVSVTDSDNVINQLSNSKELPMSVEDSFDLYIQSWTNATGRTIKTKSSEVAKKAKRSLSARLKEGYTLEEITSAIQKAAKDRHHSESGCKWLTLDFILRPDQLEKWREDPKQKENSRNELEQLIAKKKAERSQRG